MLRYALGFIARPRSTSDRLAADPHAAWIGMGWALVFLGAYALTVLIYYLLGHEPVTRGFLTVSPGKWYLVQTFTTIPVGLAGFLSCGALAHLLARAWGGTGSFEATFASQVLANVIPCTLFMLVPELFVAPFLIAAGRTALPWPEWVESLRVFILPLSWLFALSVLSLARVQKIAWPKALLIVPAAVITMGLLMAVFIR
jgi:hypothetical protein